MFHVWIPSPLLLIGCPMVESLLSHSLLAVPRLNLFCLPPHGLSNVWIPSLSEWNVPCLNVFSLTVKCPMFESHHSLWLWAVPCSLKVACVLPPPPVAVALKQLSENTCQQRTLPLYIILQHMPTVNPPFVNYLATHINSEPALCTSSGNTCQQRTLPLYIIWQHTSTVNPPFVHYLATHANSEPSLCTLSGNTHRQQIFPL